jgi:hypothetical protein
MSHGSKRTLEARFERLLDCLFWCGVEVSVLSLPVLVLILGAPYPLYASLCASIALAACAVGVAFVRGGYLGLDGDGWPRFADWRTLPFRAGYYGGSVGLGTFVGVEAMLRLEATWVALPVCVGVVCLSLGALPRSLVTVRRVSRVSI